MNEAGEKMRFENSKVEPMKISTTMTAVGAGKMNHASARLETGQHIHQLLYTKDRIHEKLAAGRFNNLEQPERWDGMS
jgi:hypothetical protein